MKRLSVLAAVAILACGAAAFVRPAIAQQDQAQANDDDSAKRPAKERYVWTQHGTRSGVIGPLSPRYTIRSADGEPARATDDADSNVWSKGGDEIEDVFQAPPQKQWTAAPYRTSPSSSDDSSTTSTTTTP